MAEEDTMVQDMMSMMFVIMMVAVLSQMIPGAALAAPPVTPTVYTCPYCGAEFASQAELDYHIGAVHPEAPTVVPAVEIVKVYLRVASPSVSEAHSGWIHISPVGSELNLALFGSRIQAGVILRNPTSSPLKYTPTIYNRHWMEPNNYITEHLTLPSVEPEKFAGAPGQGNPPTGMPYNSYQYEADKLLLPSGELAAGETGFVYTALYYQSRRWNNIYIEIESNGYDLGKTLLYSGWYSY